MLSSPAHGLSGTLSIPGDKSISHRALMFGALAIGETVITGLLQGEDVQATAAALRAMGAEIITEEDGTVRVHGVGVGGLREPDTILDMGNSGTSTRLLAGLVSPYGFTTFFTGDNSLRKRPMQRIAEPLSQMGARFLMRSGGRLPMAVTGTDTPIPITYRLPMPSAQVKSAILLAGLNTAGITTVIEPEPTRDHSERMLRHFGAEITTTLKDDGTHISVRGYPDLRGKQVQVPSDPSSAAFFVAAALITKDSSLTLPAICLNPTRAGFLQTLSEMGAEILIHNRRIEGGEEVGDLTIHHQPLKGADIPASRAPSQIDEYPILAVCAAFARGTTRFRGLEELRAKESDRLAAVAAGLEKCGVRCEIEGDDLIVHGTGDAPRGGGAVLTHHDHRIAMAFLVMGLGSREGVSVDDTRAIATSFPNFLELMRQMGAVVS